MNSLIIALFILVICLVVTVGGVWALLRQKVVVDKIGNVTEIEIPFFGKLRTNYPSLVAIFMALGVSVFVLNRWTIEPDMMPFITKVQLEHPVNTVRSEVFVGAIPQQYHIFENGVGVGAPHEIRMNVVKDVNYQVIVYTVTGVDENTGQARKVVEHGRMRIVGNGKQQRGEFDAVLRLY